MACPKDRPTPGLNKQNLAQEIETIQLNNGRHRHEQAWTNRISLKRLKPRADGHEINDPPAWTNRISLKRLKLGDAAANRIAQSSLNKQNLAQEIETGLGRSPDGQRWWLEQTESRSRDWNFLYFSATLDTVKAWTNRISLKRLKLILLPGPGCTQHRLNKQNLAQEIETTPAGSWSGCPCWLEQTESRSRDWNFAVLNAGDGTT